VTVATKLRAIAGNLGDPPVVLGLDDCRSIVRVLLAADAAIVAADAYLALGEMRPGASEDERRVYEDAWVAYEEAREAVDA
jgi:hypothetical protein